MVKVDTATEIDAILKEGLPDKSSDVKSLPFGEYIYDACHKGKEGDANRRHFKRIVTLMNKLLDGNLEDMITDRDTPLGMAVLKDWLSAWESAYGRPINISEGEKRLWRLEAFLHDVGKSLHNSKHPARGLWLVSHLASDENRRVRKLYGEDAFRQIQRVVAFHDRFGVVSTGEASFAILADMLDRGTTAADTKLAAQRSFHVLVLNTIDASTYFGEHLPSEKLEDYLHDWRICCGADDSPLYASKGDRAEFERLLIELASRTEHTVDRLSRILKESYRGFYDRDRDGSSFPSVPPTLEETDFRQLVEDALIPELGFRFDDFRLDFAYITKLDYLLSTTQKIVKHYMLNGREMLDLAVCLVSVVKRLQDQFSALIRRRNIRSRVGIDLSILKSTPEVQGKIASLLSGPLSGLSYGLEWLAQEATAYPY
jgi:hypothetical protein